MPRDPKYHEVIIKQAISNSDDGQLTSAQIRAITGISKTTVSRYLLQMYDDGELLRERGVVASSGSNGQQYVYCLADGTQVPVLEKVEPVLDLVMRVVIEAKGKINSKEVARRAGMRIAYTQELLARLAAGGCVHREIGPSTEANWEYLYWATGTEGDDGLLTVDDEFVASIMEQAIKAARPFWRVGELFSKEEKHPPPARLHASDGRVVA